MAELIKCAVCQRAKAGVNHWREIWTNADGFHCRELPIRGPRKGRVAACSPGDAQVLLGRYLFDGTLNIEEHTGDPEKMTLNPPPLIGPAAHQEMVIIEEQYHDEKNV